MAQSHNYCMEIIYTCPDDECNNRCRDKHSLVEHVKNVHLHGTVSCASLTTPLAKHNQINGYYSDSPQYHELMSCPFEGCNVGYRGIALGNHISKHGYRLCEREGCGTFTNCDEGFRMHSRRDHQT